MSLSSKRCESAETERAFRISINYVYSISFQPPSTVEESPRCLQLWEEEEKNSASMRSMRKTLPAEAETAKMALELQSHNCAAKTQLCHSTTKARRDLTRNRGLQWK